MPSDENEFWRQAERDLAGPIDATVPHSARVRNFWLGGKDWYEADRAAAADCKALFPGMTGTVGRLRDYTSAAARFLAGQAGVRQFLDIGAGLPFDGPVHEVAQRAAPGCRVVYADNDRSLPGSLHTWLVLLKGAIRGTRRRVRTGQHWQPGRGVSDQGNRG